MSAAQGARRARLAIGVALALCGVSLAGAGPLGDTAVAEADGAGKARALLAKKHLVAARGGRVRAANGVELRVPPGVMRRNGFATIRRLAPGRFDLHIAAPWKGTVTVLLPVRRPSAPAVSHRVGGRWVVEPATVVGRRARLRVRSLSSFNLDEVRRYANETMSLDYRAFRARKDDFAHHQCNHQASGLGNCEKPWPYDQFNWTDDGCSPKWVPEGIYRDLFHEPCQQHDFGYRNFGNWMRLGRDPFKRAWIDYRFLFEMRRLCRDKYWSLTRAANLAACLHIAEQVWKVVGVLGVTAFFGSEQHQFRGMGRPAPEPRAPIQPIPQIEHQPLPTLQPIPVTPKPAPAPPPAPPRSTWPEQQGSLGANTFLNPYNASGIGVKIQPYQWVEVSCKVYAPQIVSANPDGYWYRIASPPWSNAYYAVANTFWNGDIPGQKPYVHFTDWAVPNC